MGGSVSKYTLIWRVSYAYRPNVCNPSPVTELISNPNHETTN
jgi:hypothetical protein